MFGQRGDGFSSLRRSMMHAERRGPDSFTKGHRKSEETVADWLCYNNFLLYTSRSVAVPVLCERRSEPPIEDQL